MQRLLLTAGVVVLLGLSSLAQETAPVPAPAEVVLSFTTEGDQHEFHVGELIPVRFSYSSARSGRYIWVSQSKKLSGGRDLDIACSPPAEPVRQSPLRAGVDGKFTEMLYAPCGGVGGGVGGGCAHCDSEQPLGAAGVGFGAPLNSYVRFCAPGNYTCVASSAGITTAPPEEKIRPALLVKSSPLHLTIVDDPGWAHAAAIAYADTYDRICRGDVPPERRSFQCFDVAARLNYLDTPDSLAAKVRFFDGRSRGWENGFWNAIRSTSHLSDALRLMTSRMQDPDVQVSTDVLQWLAMSDLRIESPDAFQGAPPASYHAQAVEELRKYVRLLGSSLSKKNLDVLLESVKTYRILAGQEYCEKQPLVPEEEQHQVLGQFHN